MKKPIRLGPLHIETMNYYVDESVAYIDLHLPSRGTERIYFKLQKVNSSWRFEMHILRGKLIRKERRRVLWILVEVGVNWPVGQFLKTRCSKYHIGGDVYGKSE